MAEAHLQNRSLRVAHVGAGRGECCHPIWVSKQCPQSGNAREKCHVDCARMVCRTQRSMDPCVERFDPPLGRDDESKSTLHPLEETQ